jgi:hypothetical protein
MVIVHANPGLRPTSANLPGKELKSERTLVFASPTHHKNVILSGAPHRSIA